LVRSQLVEIAKVIAAKRYHRQPKEDEARLIAQDGPVACEPLLQQSNLGDDEEDGDRACDEVTGSVEEEEIRRLHCHDKHDPACNHNKEQGDDVADSEDVQGNVTWTHLGFGEHFGCD